MNHESTSVKSFATILADTKEELRQFIQTRLTLLKAELQEKSKLLKLALPLAAIGVVFLATAYLLFTLGLVGLVATFLPDNPYRWCLAFVSVGVVWTLIGGITGYFAWREIQLKQLAPKRTIDVLKEDKVWIQAEVQKI